MDEDSLPYGVGTLVGMALAMLEDDTTCARTGAVEVAGRGARVAADPDMAREAARRMGSARA